LSWLKTPPNKRGSEEFGLALTGYYAIIYNNHKLIMRKLVAYKCSESLIKGGINNFSENH
jgi:hypothetical protein